MRHGIVPGEPGIFPAPFAKWYAKFLERRKRPDPPAADPPADASPTDGDPRQPGAAEDRGPEPPSGR